MTIPETLPDAMHAVYLLGNGGYDQLEYRTDAAVPEPGPDEVLIRVGAAGVNNTDVNTRIGWYSKNVVSGTNDGGDGFAVDVSEDGGWDGVGLSFPRIQGADAAGTIVAVGGAVDASRVGQRVLVRTMQTAGCSNPEDCHTLGSELDGGFAQYVAIHTTEAFAIDTDLDDVALASFPCAYSTAETMLHKAKLTEGERVLITGASGGVGSAAIQLAKRRGAHVIAVASEAKWPDIADLGADQLLDRNADLLAELGADSVDVVADVVAGPGFPVLLDVLAKQGRYITSGAIAGPIVDLDVRTLYLKDLTMLGSTFQPVEVFENLISYIERGEIRPVVANTYPLADIVKAQQHFLEKRFAGKLVLIPPS